MRGALKFFLLGLLFFALISWPGIAFSHERDEVVIEEVNSFELFWPMVAGKTVDDGFIYNLKLFKERVRGWFIFGATQKADYQVFLGTKRVLEAEKLLAEEKDELAQISLERATVQLSAAQDSFQKAKGAGNPGYTSRLRSRAENITKLVSWLATTEEGEAHSFLEKVESEASVLLSDN